MTRSVRKALVASVTRDVAVLVERDAFRSLEIVMEATGYLSNRWESTSQQIGAAIVALAGIIEPSWLTGTAQVAAFERVFRRPNGKEPGRESNWDRAHKAAVKAVTDAGWRVAA